MSLTVVSTPIGNSGDITLRAIETLKEADIIICEEFKPARILLKRLGIGDKDLRQLNEHSKLEDLGELVDLCCRQKVALISDCGTPGFCDPGADLVSACRERRIPVDVNPGVSSLMTLIALSGVKLQEFYFAGFLPAEKVARAAKLAGLEQIQSPFVVMDTPYRLQATLEDLAGLFPEANGILGVDLTGEKHQLVNGPLKMLASRSWEKLPFVILVVNSRRRAPSPGQHPRSSGSREAKRGWRPPRRQK